MLTYDTAAEADADRGMSGPPTVIWIEPVLRPDGRKWYVPKRERITTSGLLHRTRLGGPDGDLLCDRVYNPVCESCCALMARGITGPFETRKPDVPYPCMTGDIEKAAGLTISEPDNGVVHFIKWNPFDKDALSRSTIIAPASEDGSAGRGKPAEAFACPRSDGEAAE